MTLEMAFGGDVRDGGAEAGARMKGEAVHGQSSSPIMPILLQCGVLKSL